jgi:hypothetical protein
MFVSPESRWRDLFNCLFVFLVVGVIGFGFDGLLVREGIPRLAILLLSNALTGIAVALLYFQVVRIERERRRAMQQRLRTIAEMNHHIRNALQVITYVTATEDRASVELIRTSVERIEWALREVLPAHLAAPPLNSESEPAEHHTSPIQG